jgi:hypothetical protein
MEIEVLPYPQFDLVFVARTGFARNDRLQPGDVVVGRALRTQFGRQAPSTARRATRRSSSSLRSNTGTRVVRLGRVSSAFSAHNLRMASRTGCALVPKASASSVIVKG